MELNESKLYSFRVCMVKPEYKGHDFDFFLSDSAEVKAYNIKEEFNFDSKIWIKTSTEKRPKWASLLDELNGEPIENILNSSSSAVLFIRVPEKGIIIFLFGYGRFLINQAYIQGDFGIKTALNCLDHKTLRSIDSMSLDEQAVQKRTQASRYSNISAFGIDVSKDILRSVTGLPKTRVSFHSISGGDAFFGFSKKMFLVDLMATSEELINYYNQDDYKENFEWIDNIKRIRKDEVLETLNNQLLEKIKSKDSTSLYLNVPEIISYDKIDGFSFTRVKDKVFPNLNIINYFDSFEIAEYNEEKFKRDFIFIFDGINDSQKYPIYRCVYTELTLDNKIYIYFNAEWFEIDKDFTTSIDQAISSIKNSQIEFPKIHKTTKTIDGQQKEIIEKESDYNIKAAKAIGCYNLDQKLIRTKMVSSPIEVCDLFTKEKQFIHVKNKKGGSASLSHLFSQGYVSAETLLSDREFRKSARKKLKEVDAEINLIPLEKLKSQEYEVIFLVLGDEAEVRKSLPFFSKVNLFRTYKELTQRGFKVSLNGVGFE